jgi:Ca-activated chloride channel family protein
MLQLEHTEYLWGLLVLLPLALLFYANLHWKAKKKQQLGNAVLISQLTTNYSSKKFNLKIICILIAIIAIIVAATNPRKPDKNNSTATNGIDVMIALDVSKSMLSQDEKPTRLDKAKQFIYQLSQNLQNNNIGLIVFAGEAFLQMPLTSDMAAAKIFISNASPDLVNLQGTVVSDALYLCDASLNTKEKKSKAVVLITDGEDHDAKALDAAKKLTEHGAAVYTIGVGSIQGSPILDAVTNEYKRDRDGQTIITKLNETLLKDLAKATNGSYNILDNTATVAATLANELNSLEKKPISSSGGNINYQSFYMYLLAFALVLLSIEFFMSERKLKLA